MSEPAVAIGAITVHSVIESVLWVAPDAYLPHADAHALAERIASWTEVSFDAEGRICSPVRSYVLETPDGIVVIDTGLGPDSVLAASPRWHVELNPYFDGLSDIGVEPADVRFVLTTHLHPDHFGWHTRPEHGRREPTFPNARYVIARPEWEGWAGEAPEWVSDRLGPLFDADLVELVAADAAVTPHVRFEPSHGHTPGHVCVRVSSSGAEAVFSGDVVHHKLQLGVPEEPDGTDRADPEGALATRRAFYERCASERVLVFGSHFEAPAVGRIARDGAAYRFEPMDP